MLLRNRSMRYDMHRDCLYVLLLGSRLRLGLGMELKLESGFK